MQALAALAALLARPRQEVTTSSGHLGRRALLQVSRATKASARRARGRRGAVGGVPIEACPPTSHPRHRDDRSPSAAAEGIRRAGCHQRARRPRPKHRRCRERPPTTQERRAAACAGRRLRRGRPSPARLPRPGRASAAVWQEVPARAPARMTARTPPSRAPRRRQHQTSRCSRSPARRSSWRSDRQRPAGSERPGRRGRRGRRGRPGRRGHGGRRCG
mmetsp:Transcript_8656/g.30939  ORF Transcript_8656/g.30939 Transcript_8656/m.30939 type:complete len:218 (-) Transcript_8656:39-692(-)